MNRVENAAIPLGLNVAMNTFTPGIRRCGKPALVGVTPSTYLPQQLRNGPPLKPTLHSANIPHRCG